MKRIVLLIAAAMLWSTLVASHANAADTSYLSVRGGIFLPNGKGNDSFNGFKFFDNGYDVDVAAGYRPEPYVALEVGTGFYTASGKVTTSDQFVIDRTAYGVPFTLTAKGILEFEKLTLSAGGGLGYYQAFISSDITPPAGRSLSPVSETNHGAAVGYQAALDSEFRLSERWTAGAYFKWFSARPEIELKTTGYKSVKEKWEVGGAVINLGARYCF